MSYEEQKIIERGKKGKYVRGLEKDLRNKRTTKCDNKEIS